MSIIEQLMRGNFIKFNNLILPIRVVSESFIIAGQYQMINACDIKPLPLDSEIIDRFCISYGSLKNSIPVFENIGDSYASCNIIYIPERNLITVDTEICNCGEKRESISTLYEHIKYVHQLQNLFHSLTGKQLIYSF